MFSRLHGSIICCLVLAIAFVGSVAARGPAPAITRIPITSLKSTANGETPYGDGTKGQYLAPNTTTTRKFLRETGTGSAGQAPAWDTIAAGDITSGLLALARGGTNADLSATGGTSQYVKQLSSGAAFTVGTIPAADVPNAAGDVTGPYTALVVAKANGNSFPSGVVLGDIIYGSAANTLLRLAGNTTSAKQFLSQTGTGSVSAAPAWGALAAADIPGLDASKITTGLLALARGGTNADLSATGGAHQILKQTSAGGAVTVAALVAGDIPVAPTVVALTDAATITVDASLGNHFRVTLGGNRTMGAPTNPTDGQKILFELIQDGTGSRTMAWNAIYVWGTDVTVPTLTTTINKRDFVGFVYNSTATKWYGLAVAKGY